MIDFLANHAKEIISFVTGALGGSLVTFKFTRQNRIQGSGTIADQSKAQAGGDIVGRDKTVTGNRS
jgi:hypothetical protein